MKHKGVNAPVVLSLIAGGVLTALLVVYVGAGRVMDAVTTAGVLGLIVVVVAHLPSMVLCALAWRCLVPRAPRRASILFIQARWIRDAAASLIPLLPISGELVAVRLLALHGVSRARAGASVVVDVTAELIGQFLFTLMGLGLLILHNPGGATAYWVSIALALSLPALLAFVLLQNTGVVRWLERLSERIARSWRGKGLRGLHRGILITYARRRRLYASIGLHLIAWIAGAAEAWFGLRVLGHGLGVGEVLVLESLVYALRSVAFVVPSAVGVQEGGYVLLGAIYGLPPETALALSLLKRGREVVLGIPGLLAWQWLEGGRLWNRTGLAARGSTGRSRSRETGAERADDSEPPPLAGRS